MPEQNDGYPHEGTPQPTVTEPGDSSAPGANQDIVPLQQTAPGANNQVVPAGQQSVAQTADTSLHEVPLMLAAYPAVDVQVQKTIQTFTDALKAYLDPAEFAATRDKNMKALWAGHDNFTQECKELSSAATAQDTKKMLAGDETAGKMTEISVHLTTVKAQAHREALALFKESFETQAVVMAQNANQFLAQLEAGKAGQRAANAANREAYDNFIGIQTDLFEKQLKANLAANTQKLDLYNRACSEALHARSQTADQELIEEERRLETLRKEHNLSNDAKTDDLVLYERRKEIEMTDEERKQALQDKAKDNEATRHAELRARLQEELKAEDEAFERDFKVATDKAKESKNVDLKWNRPYIDWTAQPPCIVKGWVRTVMSK